MLFFPNNIYHGHIIMIMLIQMDLFLFFNEVAEISQFLFYFRYLDLNHKKTISTEYLPKEAAEEIKRICEEADKFKSNTSEGGPPKKKPKLKGRNKHRPVPQRIDAADRLCPNIVGERECRFGDKCRYSHNVKEFMEKKPKDLGDKCHIFETYGKCMYGVACRFATQHLTPELENVVNQERFEKSQQNKSTYNALDKDLQIQLRKRGYQFDKADVFIKTLNQKGKGQKGTNANENTGKVGPREGQLKDATKSDVSDSCSSAEKLPEECTSSNDGSNNKKPNPDSVSKLGTSLSKTELGPEACTGNKAGGNGGANSHSGTVTDEDVIKLRPEEKKKVSGIYF